MSSEKQLLLLRVPFSLSMGNLVDVFTPANFTTFSSTSNVFSPICEGIMIMETGYLPSMRSLCSDISREFMSNSLSLGYASDEKSWVFPIVPRPSLLSLIGCYSASASDMSSAIWITAGASPESRPSGIRSAGPETLTAAKTRPLESRTGAPMQRRPVSISSSSIA